MDEYKASTSATKSYFKPHVLLIDDDDCELQRTASMFEANSCTVTKTSTNMDAWNILKNKSHVPNKIPKIDMVCMSISPGEIYLGEPELLDKIKRVASTNLPLVILTSTGFLYTDTWNKLEEAGAVAYITKPVNHIDVSELVENMDWEPYNVLEFEENKKKKRTKGEQIVNSNFSSKKSHEL